MSDSYGYDTALEDEPTGAEQTADSGNDKTKDVDPKIAAFVESWQKRIKAAKTAKKTKDAFDRMDECMALARRGATKEWDNTRYIVPILNRLVGQVVAQLYARNPTAIAARRRRRMFTIWDGTMSTLKEATDQMQQAMQTGMPPDPQSAAIVADAEKVKQYNIMLDGVGDTLTILHNYFIQDPAAKYKRQFKGLIRRVEVCGVGYVKLGYQRIMQKDPDVTTKLNDATEQMATLRGMIAGAARDALPEESAQMEQIRTLTADLQQQETVIVREGPIWSFPKSKRVIIDPACEQLSTLVGADWTAEEYHKTPEEIEEDWQVDVGQQFTAYRPHDTSWQRWGMSEGRVKEQNTARVWRVMNRKAGQEFVICEGYPDYVKPPAPPAIKLRRFFDIFPLVFDEIEDDEGEIYPPSDVWNCRFSQSSYNSKRQGIREHRMANRPGYVTTKGTFSEGDLNKFENHPTAAIIELDAVLDKDQKVSDKIQAKPVMQIDPKQYEVDSDWQDILRVTGQQQANMGPVADTTATEASISEESRQVGQSDRADDIDDFLTELVGSTGEVMLLNMTRDTVVQIVGPGAVWPEMPDTREEIAEDVTLGTRAGASGRPNAQQDLTRLQTAMPFVLQMPGVNPIPLGQKYMDLLLPDHDVEDAIVEGLPSITAMNNMAAKPPSPVTGGPGGAAAEPAAQGPVGQQNVPRPPGAVPGPQPAFPAPTMHR